MNSDFILKIIIESADKCIENNDFEGAFKLYSDVADIVPDTEDGITVKYNLASMYAQGIGCKKNLIKAASLYKDCAGSGDDDAEKRVLKCFLDYVIDNSDKEMFEFSANINKFISVIFTEESETSYVIRELMDYFYATNREKIADKLSDCLADFD